LELKPLFVRENWRKQGEKKMIQSEGERIVLCVVEERKGVVKGVSH